MQTRNEAAERLRNGDGFDNIVTFSNLLDDALAAERRATVERIRERFIAKWEPVVPGQGMTVTRRKSILRWAEIRKGHVLAILDEEAAR